MQIKKEFDEDYGFTLAWFIKYRISEDGLIILKNIALFLSFLGFHRSHYRNSYIFTPVSAC
jgi:hypothetical protein